MLNKNHSFTESKNADSAKRLETLLEQARTGKMELGEWDKGYDERLSHEMTLFREKGYEDICLLLHDICNLGKASRCASVDTLRRMLSTDTKVGKYEKCLCTHAEASSLVFYLLGITPVDPVKYGLVFEHFLYEGGSAAPAITLDTPAALEKNIQAYLRENAPGQHILALHFPELDALAACFEAIEAHYGDKIDPDRIPLEQEVFCNIYAAGNTQGVFEFGFERPADILRRLEADSMEDVMLAYALIRRIVDEPIEQIAKAKRTGMREASCLTEIPELEDILKPTYGFAIYQEQVLQIIHQLAGCPLDAAQRMWKNLSRKRTAALEKDRSVFLYGSEPQGIAGCARNGISLKNAEMIFQHLQTITPYTVSKSHAAARCMLSYETAWLKYHYESEFAAYISKVQDRLDETVLPVDGTALRG